MRITPTLFLLFFLACQQTPDAVEPAETNTIEPEHTEEIALGKPQIATAGVEWSDLSMQKNTTTKGLQLNGITVVHPEHLALVSAPVDGILDQLYVRRNQKVKKGAAVASLKVPDMIDWQWEYLEARARMPFVEAEYQRYKTLKDADAGALKNYQKVASEYEALRSRLAILTAKLGMYGIAANELDEDNLQTRIQLKSSVAGVVTDILASSGEALQVGHAVCKVADQTRMDVDLWVYEKDLPYLKIGDAVAVRSSADQEVIGEVTSIDVAIDPERRAARAHLSGNWPTHWAQGTFVTATVQNASAGHESGWLLDASAVVQELDGPYVFLHIRSSGDVEYFKKVRVKTHLVSDKQIIAIPQSSVPEKAAVVQKGAYYIAAEGAGIEVEE